MARLGRVRQLLRRLASRHAPSLVHHLISLQVVTIAAIGMLSLACLAWMSRQIIENNLSHWATQWTNQLGELGAPLYLSDQNRALFDVERFIATYPEIEYVNWYGSDGTPKRSMASADEATVDLEPLGKATVAALAGMAGSRAAYMLDENPGTKGRFRLIGPIWTESLTDDGLIGFDAGAEAETTSKLLGFVEVELDYSWYYAQLMSKLKLGSLFLIAMLGLSWVGGRRMLKRALLPLSQLQEPLAELAKGNMALTLAPSRYREIQNIVKTLEDTAAALEQRDRRLVHLATHDPLTGLYNRNRFVEELAAEIGRLPEGAPRSAVFFIDLDQFKYVNDTCGHPAGDEMLRLAAQCIRGATRKEDVVARFGGDEFTVLARHVTRQQAQEIALKIIEQMRLLTQVHGSKVFHLQCSVGVAMLRSGQLDSHEYLAQADIACHAAKAKGRNRFEIYKASDRENQQMAREIAWIQIVRDALERNAFVLVYQPLVDIKTGWAYHYEVLLRLETGRGELIPPEAFLPAAGRFGLVIDIDRWVVEHALRALAGFREKRPELRFSVNLSASVLEDRHFAAHVIALLDENGIPPQAIVFEITEQMAVRFAMQVDKQLTTLRELGCGFAIDDFGKGYSSFSYLKQLPVDYLKIDGSFVERLDRDRIDQTMVRMIGELGRAAGIKTVAEYVQNGATLDLLAKFGIDYAQGFYLGKPSRIPEEREFPVGRSTRQRASRRA